MALRFLESPKVGPGSSLPSGLRLYPFPPCQLLPPLPTTPPPGSTAWSGVATGWLRRQPLACLPVTPHWTQCCRAVAGLGEPSPNSSCPTPGSASSACCCPFWPVSAPGAGRSASRRLSRSTRRPWPPPGCRSSVCSSSRRPALPTPAGRPARPWLRAPAMSFCCGLQMPTWAPCVAYSWLPKKTPRPSSCCAPIALPASLRRPR